jgi:hypothetical protein
MPGDRFPMRLDPWWRPLLLIGGATPGTSYVELEAGTLTLRFGWLFRQTIPRSHIDGAVETRWPPWYGIGWRTTFRGRFGLIGSLGGVVEIRLRTPIRVWRVLACQRLVVSMEEPERFLAALASFTPNYWAMQAFQDLMFRGATIPDVATNLGLLMAFAAALFAAGLARFTFAR